MKKLIILILAIILVPSMVHAFRLQSFVGTPTFALTFDGNDHAVREVAALTVAYPFSYAVTFRSPQTGSGIMFCIGASDNTNVRYAAAWGPSGILRLLTSDGGGTELLDTVTRVDDGTFVTAVFVWASATSRLLYTSTESVSETDSVPFSGEVDQWSIGSLCDQTESSFLSEDISNVKFFDEAISEGDAKAYIADQRNVPSGLVNHWDFNEGTGTTLEDIVGSNNGTIDGATWIEI